MSAPRSGWYGKIAMQACPSPCTPECPKRSAECHFKGNCPEYEEWQIKYAATLEAVKAKYDGERSLNNMLAIKHHSKGYLMTVAHNRRLDGSK